VTRCQALTVVDEVFVCIGFLFVLSLICNDSSFHGSTFLCGAHKCVTGGLNI